MLKATIRAWWKRISGRAASEARTDAFRNATSRTVAASRDLKARIGGCDARKLEHVFRQIDGVDDGGSASPQ